ncbi:hypothetical protein QP568_07535 [Propionimicrobium lymphophilum]|uniref:hypothetical protein n=1 Tax=Propionimicrobium lymphophilum TaxID=33012 RepID=UPI00254F1FB3|nr:hypothetical protein [Propionimicrobium lymphophilum]MDK7710123.1 hypothetical protein [Propionimicrobium lymphophilum]MDK7734138.1 hypothetical protein [Propionimicrobium lymphophilum]
MIRRIPLAGLRLALELVQALAAGQVVVSGAVEVRAVLVVLAEELELVVLVVVFPL